RECGFRRTRSEHHAGHRRQRASAASAALSGDPAAHALPALLGQRLGLQTMMNAFWRKFLGPWLLASVALAPAAARAPAPADPTGNENDLGEFVVTGHKEEKLPRIAILPSLSPDLEDVVTRSVVRRDIELTGLFELISDSKAPTGLYSFDDPVDVEAWQ